MSNRTDIVVETDNAEGQVLLSASRVYDLTEDKTQDTINSEVRNTLNQLEDGLITVNYGDTAESTILVNKYVYVNDHSTIPEGLYQNRSGNTIDVGTALTFNPGNLSTATGIINSLKNNVDNLISYIDYHGYTSYSFANWKTAISDNWSNIQKNFITRVKLSNSDITVIVSPMLENVNPAFYSSYGACLVFGRDIAVPCYGKLSNGVWSWSDENVAYVQLLGATSGTGSKTLSDSYTNYRYIVLVAFGDSSGLYPTIIPKNMLLGAGYSLCVASKFNGTIGITAVQFSSSTTVNINSNPNTLRIYGIK